MNFINNFYERIISQAFGKVLSSLSPLEHGWKEQESSYVFKWFDGDQLKSSVSDLIEKFPGNFILKDSIFTLL